MTNIKERFQAAAIHLIFSMLVVGCFLSVVYFIWYPYPYYIMHFTLDAIKLVVVVDLLLGPFLTFVIFNLAKPARELMRDLTIIVIFQLAALLWGIHITHAVRPLFTVFFDGEFISITDVNINIEDLNSELRVPGLFSGPEKIYINSLTQKEYKTSIVKQLSGTEPAIVLQPERYQALTKYKEKVLSRQLGLDVLQSDPDKYQLIEEFLSSKNITIDEVALYPVSAGSFRATLVANKADMSFIGLLDVLFARQSEYYGINSN